MPTILPEWLMISTFLRVGVLSSQSHLMTQMDFPTYVLLVAVISCYCVFLPAISSMSSLVDLVSLLKTKVCFQRDDSRVVGLDCKVSPEYLRLQSSKGVSW